jgi:PAS domain S-box-containing protein
MHGIFLCQPDRAKMRPLTVPRSFGLKPHLSGNTPPSQPGPANSQEKRGLTLVKEGWRWRGLWLALLLQLFSGIAVAAIASHPAVVILSSYHQGFEWSDKELSGLLDKLRQVYPTMDPAIEYLDAKRFPGQAQVERMQRYLADKYRGKKIDLVIVLDNAALNMALHYRQEIFPGVPLVFAGINDFSPAMLQGQKKVTGVTEAWDIAGALDLALSLHPGAKEVLVIHDYTATGLAARREVEALLPAFKGRVKVSFTPPATFQEILQQVKSLPPGSIGLITGFATDRLGVSLSQSESTRLLTAAGVPFYAMTEPRLGHGIVGGVLLGGREHGRRAGEIALRVLGGEDASRIPVDTKSTAKPMFDYLQLARFGIPLKALPGGSVIINRPLSFYDQNRQWIWGVSAITVFLSLVIFILSTNIMRRRKAEQKQQEYLNFLQILMDAIPNPVFYKDSQGLYLGCNKACEEAWGISREELIGKTVFEQHPRDLAETYHSRDAELFRQPGVQVYETSVAHADGTRKDVILLKATFTHLDGSLGGLIGIEMDITERKRAEEQVLASLKEKEVLLKEIHHRVKNNMQIISTLLALQAKYDQGKNPAAVFQDCQNRIRSMALIHESLYNTENLASINFRHYLEQLGARLLASYGSAAQGLKVTMAGADWYLDISQAVPCGLIANELMVNSLKHAFPGRKEGEIQVSLEVAGDRRILEVRDNGVGLGPDFDLENPATFGWLMVKNLTKQLGGNCTVQSNGGTSCRIVF